MTGLPLTDLTPNQCRYPCEEIERDSHRHRFCGAQTFIGPGNLHGSWCPEHLKVVWAGQSNRADRKPEDDERVQGVA